MTAYRSLAAFLLTVILTVGLAATGVGLPSVYVDQTTGFEVNRSDPEYTVMSYYQLLDNKSYDGAYQMFTPEAQKQFTSKDLASQFKNIKVNSAKVTKVFPAVKVNNFGAVTFIRNLSVPKLNEEQVVLGIHFLKRDNFGDRWAIIGTENEISENLKVQFFENVVQSNQDLITKIGSIKGYSSKQQESLVRQAQSLHQSNMYLLQQIKEDLTQENKLELVDPEQEFIMEYAPYMATKFLWGQSLKDSKIPNHPALDD